MKVEIICPLYKGKQFIDGIVENVNKQKNVDEVKLLFILTDTKDGTEEYLNEKKCNYDKILPSEFSHSLTREKYALKSKSDVIVFISQDVEIADENWLYNLISDIGKDNIVAAYSRQVTKYDNIEKYTREKNYPDIDKIVSKDDIEELGLRTFFFSDASSAIKTSIFKELNGYDGKNLTLSEDMYIAYKIIMNGYKIKYASKSVIYHSHKFTLKQLYDRYKLTGKFFKQNSYLNKYNANKAGGGLAKYILKMAIKEKNYKVLLRFIPDMAARYIGMQVGKRF